MARRNLHRLIVPATALAFGLGWGAAHLTRGADDLSGASGVISAGGGERAVSAQAPAAQVAQGAAAAGQGQREAELAQAAGVTIKAGAVPFAPCPSEPEAEPDWLLDTAAARYEAGEFAIAHGCASVAADLVPGSIDAHHIRALAAAALGHLGAARDAYALALALDPDDPETLAAAANFYINTMQPKRREATQLGFEYAHRGRSRVVARRRGYAPLRARLAVLEAQALNDLGNTDDALVRLEEAIALAPEMAAAHYERVVALFNACRFEGARAALERVLTSVPDDPYTHHHLGLVHERRGDLQAAAAHFARARALAPQVFRAPVAISPAEFRAEVERAIDELPSELAGLLDEVALELTELPDDADLTAVTPPFSPTILGLYRGLPLGVEAPAGDLSVPPRAVVLYRANLARAAATRAELNHQIRRTLRHELGHVQGLDESQLRLRGLD
ncbi:MAG: hypothetical protein Tsb0020_06220 [Haliangiales bacterium]